MLADGSLARGDLIDCGMDGYVYRNSPSTVIKIPRLTGIPLPDGTIQPDTDNLYANDLANEKAIYQRLEGVTGIAECLRMSANGIILEYYSKGSLEKYMQHNAVPEWSQRLDWIMQIIDAIAAYHAKNVLVFDIALRNFLLANDMTIRTINFSNSSLLPLIHTGDLVDSEGYTVQLDVLHLTNVIYSLGRWKKFSMDCVDDSEWPQPDSLPSTSDLPLGNIISKSWAQQFSNLDELRHAVTSTMISHQ